MFTEKTQCSHRYRKEGGGETLTTVKGRKKKKGEGAKTLFVQGPTKKKKKRGGKKKNPRPTKQMGVKGKRGREEKRGLSFLLLTQIEKEKEQKRGSFIYTPNKGGRKKRCS